MTRYEFKELSSGAALCSAPHNDGAIMIVCDDLSLTPLQRADRARQQVDEILERLAGTPSGAPVRQSVTTAAVNTGLKVSCDFAIAASGQPQQPALIEVHAAPAHRRESSD
jgi:hypothetical protein